MAADNYSADIIASKVQETCEQARVVIRKHPGVHYVREAVRQGCEGERGEGGGVGVWGGGTERDAGVTAWRCLCRLWWPSL